MLKGQRKAQTKPHMRLHAQNQRNIATTTKTKQHKSPQNVSKRIMSTQGPPVPGQPFVSNITPTMEAKIGRNLHRKVGHPVCTIKDIIFNHINTTSQARGSATFKTYDDFSPEVTVTQNFTDLLVPDDHPSRSLSDTFYRSPEVLLRPHTSAHQTQLLRKGDAAFLVAGDCYRRDEIDASHYPVFHQMEGVKVWDPKDLPSDPEEATKLIVADLKQTLESLAKCLFGEDAETRWIEAYFPFTNPSLELEVMFNGKWLEVLGCGVIQQKIMDTSGVGHKKGWAFGLGLDRLAMVLFEVPDIRLFWSEDDRFVNQFKPGEITKFVPFSKYPGTHRDVSFWYDPAKFHDNDFFAVVREYAGDCVDNVELKDHFVHPKTGRNSKMFRVHYRSLERTLETDEVNGWQDNLRNTISTLPSIELR